MIDIANYKQALAWLRRAMAEQELQPDDQILRDNVWHSFEVTYNVSESTLRHALAQITGEDTLAFVSSREVMRCAAEEGIYLSSGKQWLRYGIALEQTDESLGDTFSKDILPLLPQFAANLEAFAIRLEGRLASHA